MKQQQIAILTTGNEIMKGITMDTNSHFLCQECNQFFLPVKQIFCCGDDLVLLAKTIDYISSNFDLLIITGGLGPTTDDLTCQALAKAINRPLIQNPQAAAMLQHWLQKRGQSASTANLKQALLPDSSLPLPNDLGSAPGVYQLHKKCHIFCLPGVPTELYAMWHKTVKPLILEKLKFAKVTSKTFRIFGLGESVIQQLLTEDQYFSQHNFNIGFRVVDGYIDCTIALQGDDSEGFYKNCQIFYKLFASYIVSQSNGTLAQICVDSLIAEKKKIAVAESLTGGLLCSLLTAVQGASQAFEQGWVSYSNQAKNTQLSVDKNLIDEFGAVSMQAAAAMANQALTLSGSDYAVAITGYAGPSGGDVKNPIGTVYIAWVQSQQSVKVRRFYFLGTRNRIQKQSAACALDGLRRIILKLPRVNYSFDNSQEFALTNY